MININDNNKEMENDFSEEDFYNADVNNNEEESDNQFDEEIEIESEVSEEVKLKEEVKKEKDNFLRLFAEFENYKKRTSKERIELFSTANKELMTALLPILDDFERGMIEMEKSSDIVLFEGVQLIYNKFKNTLTQKGLKDIETEEGEVFDAEIHEAISQIPAPSVNLKGKIIDVVEKGYKLGDTIIRYPKVVIGS